MFAWAVAADLKRSLTSDDFEFEYGFAPDAQDFQRGLARQWKRRRGAARLVGALEAEEELPDLVPLPWAGARERCRWELAGGGR